MSNKANQKLYRSPAGDLHVSKDDCRFFEGGWRWDGMDWAGNWWEGIGQPYQTQTRLDRRTDRQTDTIVPPCLCGCPPTYPPPGQQLPLHSSPSFDLFLTTPHYASPAFWDLEIAQSTTRPCPYHPPLPPANKHTRRHPDLLSTPPKAGSQMIQPPSDPPSQYERPPCYQQLSLETRHCSRAYSVATGGFSLSTPSGHPSDMAGWIHCTTHLKAGGFRFICLSHAGTVPK
ncbi:hypothetical protein DL95DRAFT_413170 [Leptodontidium sp. 2 PMI_412]|nr:hypothetical protein DL95DRAFT_413170 [Leptodontidium sp. 2 PMI_412]